MSIAKLENYQKSIRSLMDDVKENRIETLNAEERHEVDMILSYMNSHSKNVIETLKKLQSTETGARVLAQLVTVENNSSFMTCMDATVEQIMNPNSDLSRTINTLKAAGQHKLAKTLLAGFLSILILTAIILCITPAMVGVFIAAAIKMVALILVGVLGFRMTLAMGHYVDDLPLTKTIEQKLYSQWQTPSKPVKMRLNTNTWGERREKHSTNGAVKLQFSNQTFFTQNKKLSELVEERYQARFGATV